MGSIFMLTYIDRINIVNMVIFIKMAPNRVTSFKILKAFFTEAEKPSLYGSMKDPVAILSQKIDSGDAQALSTSRLVSSDNRAVLLSQTDT